MIGTWGRYFLSLTMSCDSIRALMWGRCSKVNNICSSLETGSVAVNCAGGERGEGGSDEGGEREGKEIQKGVEREDVMREEGGERE